jgi:nitroreductase
VANSTEVIGLPNRVLGGAGALDLLRSWRSMPRVQAELPPCEVIGQVIDVTVWAPNHHLTEHCRFIVLANEAR